MSYLKTEQDLTNLKRSCLINTSLLRHCAKNAKAGQDCGDWNSFTQDFFAYYKAVSSFINHMGYKYHICISINDEVVHGIAPVGKIITDNSVVSFDCGCIFEGMYSDSAITAVIGKVDPNVYKLIETCQTALNAGIEICKSGVKVRDIARAIGDIVKKSGFGNVHELGGHGAGYEVWSDPYISNMSISHSEQKTTLFTNKIICLEPMLTIGGSGDVNFDQTKEDGWTVTTKDGSVCVHFEHQLIITKNGCEVLSDFTDDELLPIPEELIKKYKNKLF
jgi:methionyl aminopeptidase